MAQVLPGRGVLMDPGRSIIAGFPTVFYGPMQIAAAFVNPRTADVTDRRQPSAATSPTVRSLGPLVRGLLSIRDDPMYITNVAISFRRLCARR